MLEYQEATGGCVHGHLGFTGTAHIRFSELSHEATLLQEGGVLMADIKILDTPKGKELRQIIQSGVLIDYRTAGVGSGKVADGVLVVGDDYRLISVDAVTHGS